MDRRALNTNSEEIPMSFDNAETRITRRSRQNSADNNDNNQKKSLNKRASSQL